MGVDCVNLRERVDPGGMSASYSDVDSGHNIHTMFAGWRAARLPLDYNRR